SGWPPRAQLRFLFVGRPAREKGLEVLLRAWEQATLAPRAALVLVGVGSRLARPLRRALAHARGQAAEIVCLEAVGAEQLRSLYAACDALVLPSIATRTFREPWGLVVNEAMNRGLPVIASDAVGAAAGGLVRDEGNGLVVPAGEPLALAQALRRMAGGPPRRVSSGGAG